jgi:hypothetical protein
MVKSLGAIFLVVLMFMWSSCYESAQITKDKVAQLDGYSDITAFVDSGGAVVGYHFARGMYSVVHDTLVGDGTVMAKTGEEVESPLSIPVSKIAYIETQKLNLVRTLLLAGTAVAAATLVIITAGSGGAGGTVAGGSPQKPQ